MLQEIRSFAVVGAGNMGSGIAQKIATEGFPATLVDLDDEKVAQGLDSVRQTLEQGVARRIFRPEQVDPILGRIRGTADWSALKTADLVIEAVFEDLAVKRKVFQRLGEVCRPETLLATNTSSFFVKDLAAATENPGRVLGLHYFYHPAKNRLVEVVPHGGTRREAVQAAWAAQEALGKIPIHSADAPGFVVNRFFVPWLNEAVRILEEGLADVPTIEEAARTAFRIGMGPFELMNVTGVPIALHAAETLGRALHPFYAPAERLRSQVASGRNWDLSGKADPSRFESVADRLLGVTFFIAASLVEEKVASVEDTDLGARVGLRWPKGPFELMNRVGIPRARALAEAAVLEHGLTLPGLLAQADEETGIPVRLVVLGQQNGLSRISIQRPDALNALNEAVVLQLEEAFRQARAEEQPGLVLAASGKAFIAGADIKFFVDNLKAGSFARIHAFTAQGQKLLRTLSGGPQPVVARVQGLALGGGAEVALACDWIAASPKASFGFPRPDWGSTPAWAGRPASPAGWDSPWRSSWSTPVRSST
ncbi:MAG: 3-hydroxyacyl-CoA dehydrogenase NAD-binding domain-containing protein, partial [Planctomycetota bacterium]